MAANLKAFLTEWNRRGPDKPRGSHAGWDESGELIYIGLGEMKMNRSVLERLDADYDKVFGTGADHDQH